MFLKKMFYASASILMLAIAYHLGAGTATAQAPSNSVVAAYQGSAHIALTANGDVYVTAQPGEPWTKVQNIFSGPTPAATQSWGSLKAKYR